MKKKNFLLRGGRRRLQEAWLFACKKPHTALRENSSYMASPSISFMEICLVLPCFFALCPHTCTNCFLGFYLCPSLLFAILGLHVALGWMETCVETGHMAWPCIRAEKQLPLPMPPLPLSLPVFVGKRTLKRGEPLSLCFTGMDTGMATCLAAFALLYPSMPICGWLTPIYVLAFYPKGGGDGGRLPTPTKETHCLYILLCSL